MQRHFLRFGMCLLLLCCVLLASALHAQPGDGPLGLHWGMPKEDVEKMGLGLCCRQVGKWGARYKVNSDDFNRFPNPLGDENKVYLYFGNTNKLLRMYIDIKKTNGLNRYKQINTIINNKYNLTKSCVRKKYTKYEALEFGKLEEKCENYEGYSKYEKNDVEVFVGLESHSTEHIISIILLHNRLYETDRDKNSPF